ncbi:hypothetical protein SAMN05216184_11365 [Georgenia satyanarayanai]|uniref:Lipoprotein n=1 Tax=Georgenia satyanarayanai TaxID=860221 RepID=A0A2Y9ALW7_9MICO|nr:hypothetical protein [Georgenia satyanarayanai]PYF97890.1 hypothetical protein A8987_11365 [Georgenia satyanarayanai]SSA45464.1 hypothetical protein SAMN05216184_11365 [Georgenia satyanarayanai]
MRRATARAACLVLLAALVGGCSSAEVDASQIGEWMSDHEHSVEDGLGQMSGRVSPDDPPAEPGSGIAMDFAAPTPVSGVRLSCFGDDTLTFFVEVVREVGNGVRSDGVEHEVSCAEGAYTADVDSPEADRIRVDAYGAEHDGAWHAVVLAD